MRTLPTGILLVRHNEKLLGKLGVGKMLEALASLVAILGGIFGAIIYVLGTRRKAIDSTRQIIARAWTNEGDIHSTESIYITLELENADGDLIGSISSSAHDRLLEAHADVGWLKTKLQISELRGRSITPFATATLKISGNNNRLKWLVKNDANQNILPVQTILWPSSVGASLG